MSASPMNTRKITRPATAVLLARKTLAESLSSSKRALCSKTVAMAFSLVPNSRIQEGVQDIENQRGDDEDDSEDEGRAHNHPHVLVKERECRPPTDAFEREDIFDDDRAAEETGHEVAVRGHGRKQRVLLRMEVVDEPLGHALRPRESDVVLLEHF